MKKKKPQANQFAEVEHYVAGIDLAGAADHYVCGPALPDGSSDIVHFGTTTRELDRMLRWLQERKVIGVAMESTSVYWIPVYDKLESAGIKVTLVDTRTVRMIPGRKSDVKDCQWLQKLHSCGLLRGAFRPPEQFNAIRMVIRERENVLAMRVQAIQGIQKSLDQMNIRLHHAVSDIDGVTGMRILAAIVAGERDPIVLAQSRDVHCKKSAEEIAEHLTGTWREEHLFNLEQAYLTLLSLNERVTAYDLKITEMFTRLAKASVPRAVNVEKPVGEARHKGTMQQRKALAGMIGFDITKIGGLGIQSAYAIVSELGDDLSMFPDENHFVSYVGLAPPLGKSAGKNVRTRSKAKNTNRVGLILRQAAVSCMRAENELGARFRSVMSRSSKAVAVKAVARRMAQYIYRGMKYGNEYFDEGERQYEERRRDRTVRMIQRKIKNLGISMEELRFSA